MSNWVTGTPAELIRALRPGGNVMGHSPNLARYFALHKSDLIRDLRGEAQDRKLLWRILGDPEATGQYASNRRTVILWLGGAR